MEVAGCLREECAREDALLVDVPESSAAPERVLMATRKTVATARMAILLHKVMIRTSLVCVAFDPLPHR